MFDILSSSLLGSVVTDKSGQILFCNSKAKQILGYSSFMKGKVDIQSFFTEKTDSFGETAVLVKLANGTEVLVEKKSIVKDDVKFEVFFVSERVELLNQEKINISSENAEAVEALKIDVLMKDIQIDRKEYELQSMKDLMYLLAGLQDIQSIATKFVDCCFQHLIFSKGMFFHQLSQEDTDSYLILVNLPANKAMDADEQRDWCQEFSKKYANVLKVTHGPWAGIDDPFRSSFAALGINRIKEVLCYPLKIDNKFLGFFLFITEEGHFGVEPEDLLLMEDLLQLVHPIFNNALLLEDSLTDELTKLKNRRMFDVSLNREIAFAQEIGKEFSLLAIDIDRFKSINDRFGHATGDQVIRSLGALLRKQIRHHDAAFRFGGEEFMVLVTGNVDGAKIVANRIQEAVRKLRIPLEDGAELQFTISIGLAQFHEGLGSLELFSLADKALYRSKNDGRDRITVATESNARSA